MEHPIKNIIRQHKRDGKTGIYSVCSANSFVLEAAMLQAKKDASFLLIEATSNQVDQFGGYTGMRPQDFADFVYGIADKFAFPKDRLILGGDHLGPNVWQKSEPQVAMQNAKDQIAAYIKAGFTKIHLDASMPLKGDAAVTHQPLNAKLVAERSAQLCSAAEEATQLLPANFPRPVYVIGTDVPIPGGATESLENLRITPVREVEDVLQQTRDAFLQAHLEEAWERVVAVVVQPGVEFGDNEVAAYDPSKSRALKQFIAREEAYIYEAHSTDYQTAQALKQMVADHFAILKVGPALTFALREALFALTFIEEELLKLHKGSGASNLRQTIEQAMLEQPQFWQKHYHGDEAQKAFARQYSFSDRIRYYWPLASVQKAIGRLFDNLKKHPIPLTLLSQFLPVQYRAVRNGEIENSAHALIYHKIQETLAAYAYATGARVDLPNVVTSMTEKV